MAAKQNESRDSERYVLTGKMYYNNLHPQYPDTAYTPRWGMALSIDSDQQSLASTHEMTIKPPTDIMSNPFINLHKNVKRMGGEDNEAPSVVDAKKNPVPTDLLNRIGWGSDVKVLVSKFYMTKWNKWGYSLDKVQLINLVDYISEDDGFSEEEGCVAGDEAPPVEASTDDPDEDLPF